MLINLVLSELPDFHLEDVVTDEQTVTLVLTASQPAAACPVCRQPSSRIHSHYRRNVHDLPWVNHVIQLLLHVRRFFCDNPACHRRIFAERLGVQIAVYARRTRRLKDYLQHFAFALGGLDGTRLAAHGGMLTSPTTLLRLMRCTALPEPPPPRVLGVDDWALRKGRTYGTILVDLERHRPVDLLPERTAEALTTWLRHHPGIEIVSRDRDTTYADGIEQGAPQATQVADRWHLLSNMREVVQKVLERHPNELRAAAHQVAARSDVPCLENAASLAAEALATPPPEATANASEPASLRQLRYSEVKALQREGWSQHAIARHLHLHRLTVRRYVQAETFPQRVSQPPLSSVHPYMAFVKERWAAGCHNQRQLWRELQQQGYSGSYASVQRALTPLRQAMAANKVPQPTAPTVRRLSARQAAWLLVRSPAELSETERAYGGALREVCSAAAAAYPLAQSFVQMIRERAVGRLDAWLAAATASTVPELQRFAAGLRRDYAAVKAALSLCWSNGQVEGQINRLKVIKRDMYGRAKFDLLRQRVLYAA